MSLLENAIRTINNLYSDTSQSPKETLEALEELQANCESKIDALKSENPDL
jgi:hypothetical protein